MVVVLKHLFIQLNLTFSSFCYIIMEWLLIIIPLLLSVALLTLVERKIMGLMQNRRGPNIVGLFGLFQPIADGLKLLCKETILPRASNINLFLISPIITFTLSLLNWLLLPVTEINNPFIYFDYNSLLILVFSSISVYGIIISGWSSNSKYAFLGSLRSTAQMISYEISFGLILLTIFCYSNSFSLKIIVGLQESLWYIIPLFPCFLMFIISILAETNRAPFDLPEAEAELVSGYNVEYSAMSFALFFLAEYANIILMSVMTTLLFLGGWNLSISIGNSIIIQLIVFTLKVLIMLVLFIWIRATFPRFRYDQLMKLGWKILLPCSFSFLLMSIACLLTFEYNLL